MCKDYAQIYVFLFEHGLYMGIFSTLPSFLVILRPKSVPLICRGALTYYKLTTEFMGQLIAILVAVCWTGTALLADVASRRVGASVLNVWRMLMALPLLWLTYYCLSGEVWPRDAGMTAWLWLLGSGFVGFVVGDYCLFHSYMVIGSRFGQLLMTLASPFAAVSAYFIMGEGMGSTAVAGMFITMSGIAMSIMGRSDAVAEPGEKKNGWRERKIALRLPLRGVLLGIGAAMGQGVGLVLSKMGMLEWGATGPDVAVAATMMRGLMGLAGFSITLLVRGEQRDLLLPLKSRVSFLATAGSVILGPFVGVSLSLMAVSMTSSGVAQTLMSLTPVFIIWPSHVLFHSRVRAIEVVGAVIAVAGAMLLF